MLNIGFDTFPYILNKCEKIFEKEPILEGAVGLTCKFVIRREGQSAPRFFIMKWVMPFWRIVKKNLHITGTFESEILPKKNQLRDRMGDDNKTKPFCIFSANTARENDFGCIFPVMKKIDEIGEKSILFTHYEVYSKRKNEIESLKNNSLIFIENLAYNLTSFEMINYFIKANKLFNELLREVKDKDVLKFVKKHKNEIIFNIEEISVISEAISKIIKDRKFNFYFSLGGFFSLINACKRYGIRTAMIQHGNFGNVENHLEYTVQPPECSPHADDEIIVWGETSKNKVKHLYGYSSNRKIYVLGNPRYDKIVEIFSNKKRSKDFYTKLNLDQKKKNVVFFSQTNILDIGKEQPHERFVEPIYALDKLLNNELSSKINLIIKLHPQESKKHYERYMENLNNVKMIKDEVSPYELYQHTDISLTVSSTTTLEAMIFKIPTLQYVLDKFGVRGERYYEHGAAILIRNADELIETIGGIVSEKYDLFELEKNQKKYLEKNLVNLGNATNKIVEHLLNNK